MATSPNKRLADRENANINSYGVSRTTTLERELHFCFSAAPQFWWRFPMHLFRLDFVVFFCFSGGQLRILNRFFVLLTCRWDSNRRARSSRSQSVGEFLYGERIKTWGTSCPEFPKFFLPNTNLRDTRSQTKMFRYSSKENGRGEVNVQLVCVQFDIIGAETCRIRWEQKVLRVLPVCSLKVYVSFLKFTERLMRNLF